MGWRKLFGNISERLRGNEGSKLEQAVANTSPEPREPQMVAPSHVIVDRRRAFLYFEHKRGSEDREDIEHTLEKLRYNVTNHASLVDGEKRQIGRYAVVETPGIFTSANLAPFEEFLGGEYTIDKWVGDTFASQISGKKTSFAAHFLWNRWDRLETREPDSYRVRKKKKKRKHVPYRSEKSKSRGVPIFEPEAMMLGDLLTGTEPVSTSLEQTVAHYDPIIWSRGDPLGAVVVENGEYAIVFAESRGKKAQDRGKSYRRAELRDVFRGTSLEGSVKTDEFSLEGKKAYAVVRFSQGIESESEAAELLGIDTQKVHMNTSYRGVVSLSRSRLERLYQGMQEEFGRKKRQERALDERLEVATQRTTQRLEREREQVRQVEEAKILAVIYDRATRNFFAVGTNPGILQRTFPKGSGEKSYFPSGYLGSGRPAWLDMYEVDEPQSNDSRFSDVLRVFDDLEGETGYCHGVLVDSWREVMEWEKPEPYKPKDVGEMYLVYSEIDGTTIVVTPREEWKSIGEKLRSKRDEITESTTDQLAGFGFLGYSVVGWRNRAEQVQERLGIPDTKARYLRNFREETGHTFWDVLKSQDVLDAVFSTQSKQGAVDDLCLLYCGYEGRMVLVVPEGQQNQIERNLERRYGSVNHHISRGGLQGYSMLLSEGGARQLQQDLGISDENARYLSSAIGETGRAVLQLFTTTNKLRQTLDGGIPEPRISIL